MSTEDQPPAQPAPEPQPPSQPQAPVETPSRGRFLLGVLSVAVVLGVLVVIFYAEENSRGKRAWTDKKAALESQQEVLDWAAYVPAPIPDESNFFKAPKMREWFVGGGSNEMTSLLSVDSFLKAVQVNSNAPGLVAEWQLRPDKDGAPEASSQLVPIELDSVPLRDALLSLAKDARLDVEIDKQVDPGAVVKITGSWTNATSAAVFFSLMCNNNLQWVGDTNGGKALISTADTNAPPGNSDPRTIVLAMLQKAVGPNGATSDGFVVGANLYAQLGPMELSVTPDGIPSIGQIDRSFADGKTFSVEPVGDALEVITTGPAPINATDYLRWSDQFSPSFEYILAAVKLPQSRMEGDYARFANMPAINFMAAGAVARLLADRADCLLLIQQPAQAFADLSLIHNLCVCLARPGGKPVTIATAVGIATLDTLYTETATFGLQLHAWREPELTRLQKELGEMELVPLFSSAIESERAWQCHFLETSPRSEVAQALALGGASATIPEKLDNFKFQVLEIMPQGWVYQNMARLASLRQGTIDAMDPTLDILRPHAVQDARQQIAAAFHSASPLSMLAKQEMPPLEKALTTMAHIQALINETQVVCALERGRIARGRYPDKLEQLVPDYIDVVPVDPIDGGPLQYHYQGGRFVLYSIGWDEKDDHGVPADAAGNGDWVWGVR